MGGRPGLRSPHLGLGSGPIVIWRGSGPPKDAAHSLLAAGRDEGVLLGIDMRTPRRDPPAPHMHAATVSTRGESPT